VQITGAFSGSDLATSDGADIFIRSL
jgi:hypothetical protein